jgi:hypothetical protein
MKCPFLALLFLCSSQPAWSQIYVPGDYPDVQTAINAASAGDTIIVQLPETGPLVIDKALTIVGDPALKLYDGTADFLCTLPWPNPVTLAGPGSGSVALVNVNAVAYPVSDCVITPAPVVGTGFDELHIIGSNLHAPASGLSGSGYGAPGVSVDVPLVMVVDSVIVGGRDNVDQCGSLFPVPGYPGIECPGGSVVVLDSEVHGGDGGLTCILSFDCPPGGSGSGLGPGGPAVVAHSLFAANSTLAGGIGSTLTLHPGGPGAVKCGKDLDGLAAEVSQLVLLPGVLQGSSVMHLGSTWSLTYLATGPLANLFLSLAPSAPFTIAGAGWAFLDPTTTLNLGPVATGVPQTLTFPIPLVPLLVGLEPSFQLLDGGHGLTRPVLSVILP